MSLAMGQQSGSILDGTYNAFRTNGAPTYYGENHTPWQADILEAGFITAVAILAISFYFILPGIHGRDRLFTFVWVTLSLFVVGVIFVSNYSMEWETSEIQASTKYKAGTGLDINASISVHIGLRGINITLKGEPVHQLNESINYNEHFSWEGPQGRIGFGPFAGEFNQEYRAAQLRGLPLPILWIAEYFTFDGEGIRWGRHYREAGRYAYMCLWLAFPLWLLSNILFFVLIRYGAYFLMMTGCSMCIANVIKHLIRNPNELAIPFSAEHILEFEYGIIFWLNLGTGGLCILCGFIILMMDLRCPSAIARFFGANVLQDDGLIQKEDSILSNSSTGTTISTNTTDTELTEIVEIGADGQRTNTMARRPQGAGYRLDDVYGDDAWTDTSDTDLEPTDDEFSDEEKVAPKRRQSQGFIGRFQRQRRQPSAKPDLNSKPKYTHKRFIKVSRVSPTNH